MSALSIGSRKLLGPFHSLPCCAQSTQHVGDPTNRLIKLRTVIMAALWLNIQGRSSNLVPAGMLAFLDYISLVSHVLVLDSCFQQPRSQLCDRRRTPHHIPSC